MSRNSETPSKEEWQEWQAHPVTEWFMWAVSEVKNDYAGMLSSGQTLKEHSDDTAQTTARTVGIVAGMESAMNIEPEIEEATS